MNGFCPLASGSKGNALYLGTSIGRLLIDVGIRASTLEKRLAILGVELQSIDAILITHEHSDHIQGLSVLAKKLQIPVLANAETAKAICSQLDIRPRFKIFTTGEMFSFKGFHILPFSVPHDTLDPVGFTIQTKDFKLGVCADIGSVTTLVRKALTGCDYLYLEANHQPSMVHACARPQIYKQRVLSRQGHLSNTECALLIESLLHDKLKCIYLAHLSSECNTKEVALNEIRKVLQNRDIPLIVAEQNEISRAIAF